MTEAETPTAFRAAQYVRMSTDISSTPRKTSPTRFRNTPIDAT